MTMFDQFTDAAPELIQLDFCGPYYYVAPAIISIYADNTEVLEIKIQAEHARYPTLISQSVTDKLNEHLTRIINELKLEDSNLSLSWTHDGQSHEGSQALKAALGITHSW